MGQLPRENLIAPEKSGMIKIFPGDCFILNFLHMTVLDSIGKLFKYFIILLICMYVGANLPTSEPFI